MARQSKDGTYDHKASCPWCPHNGSRERMGCKINQPKSCARYQAHFGSPVKVGKKHKYTFEG